MQDENIVSLNYFLNIDIGMCSVVVQKNKFFSYKVSPILLLPQNIVLSSRCYVLTTGGCIIFTSNIINKNDNQKFTRTMRFFITNNCLSLLPTCIYRNKLFSYVSLTPLFPVHIFCKIYVKNFYKYMRLLISNLSFFHAGSFFKLEIIGYIRRAWYANNQKALVLRLGYSFLNRYFLINVVYLKLIKKRILLIFSLYKDVVYHLVKLIKSLKPVDSYKLAGISLYKEKISLKKSKKQKANR